VTVKNKNILYGHEYWMGKTLALAEKAFELGEVPVGAILVQDNQILAQGHNQVELLKDPTAHAEILAITSACHRVQNWRLNKAVLYVTKEPCLMCAGAIIQAKIPKLVFGALDIKEGAAGSRYDVMREHPKIFVEVLSGVCQKEGERLLQDFFKKIRTLGTSKNCNEQPKRKAFRSD
jgi:tRNA(adenine34) deaminase